MACGGKESSDLWWLGVLMSIVASILSNLGVNVQKYSLMAERRKPRLAQRAYIRQPLYGLGLFCVVFGSIGDFAALGFAAQSLITPVGGFTMVANVVFAHFWLKEALGRKDIVGTGAIIMGIMLIAAFADKSEKCYTLDELVSFYGEAAFLIYVLAVVSVSLSLYGASKNIEKVVETEGRDSKRYRRLEKLHELVYPTLSGVLGAQSVLFAKSTAELVKATWQGENQFGYGLTYVIVTCMLATIFMQLHWLAVGLQWFDAVYVIPVFQCFFITVTIGGGAVYFKEFSEFSLMQSIMFPLGVLLTLYGIRMLSQRRMNRMSALSKFRSAGLAVVFAITVRKRVQIPVKDGTLRLRSKSSRGWTVRESPPPTPSRSPTESTVPLLVSRVSQTSLAPTSPPTLGSVAISRGVTTGTESKFGGSGASTASIMGQGSREVELPRRVARPRSPGTGLASLESAPAPIPLGGSPVPRMKRTLVNGPVTVGDAELSPQAPQRIAVARTFSEPSMSPAMYDTSSRALFQNRGVRFVCEGDTAVVGTTEWREAHHLAVLPSMSPRESSRRRRARRCRRGRSKTLAAGDSRLPLAHLTTGIDPPLPTGVNVGEGLEFVSKWLAERIIMRMPRILAVTLGAAPAPDSEEEEDDEGDASPLDLTPPDTHRQLRPRQIASFVPVRSADCETVIPIADADLYGGERHLESVVIRATPPVASGPSSDIQSRPHSSRRVSPMPSADVPAAVQGPSPRLENGASHPESSRRVPLVDGRVCEVKVTPDGS